MTNFTAQELYGNIIDSINEGICAIDSQQQIVFVNRRLTEIMGYSEEELLGKSVFDFVRLSDVDTLTNRIEQRRKGHSAAHNYLLPCKNGEEKWVSMNGRPIVSNGLYSGLIITIFDISEQKISAQLMEENFRHYVSLFEDSPIPIWDEDFSRIKIALEELKKQGVTDLRSYFKQFPEELIRITNLLIVNNINKAVVELNEAKSKREVLQNFKNNVTDDSSEHVLLQFEAILNNEHTCEFDAVLRTFRGNKRYVHLKWSVVKGYENDYSRVYLTTTDMTDRIVEENLNLQRSNQEKEVMLREIHHRVKNNLQIISSLLKLQSHTFDDELINEAFLASLNRINSMAKVHELLYRSADFSEIDYKEYLHSIIESLISTMSAENQRITFELEVDEISININTAIPLGLLINEIVTNSLKHGLSEQNEGIVYLKIQQNSEEEFTLFIGDDGVGFDEKQNKKETLGMSLIQSLTEQLNGVLSRLELGKGTHFQLEFSKLK